MLHAGGPQLLHGPLLPKVVHATVLSNVHHCSINVFFGIPTSVYRGEVECISYGACLETGKPHASYVFPSWISTHLLLQPPKASSWGLSHHLWPSQTATVFHVQHCIFRPFPLLRVKQCDPFLHVFPHRPQGTSQASCFLSYLYDTQLDNLWRQNSDDCSWLGA